MNTTRLFLSLFGLASGLVISGGIFTALLAIGLTPRFSQKTHTAKHILLYEDMIVLGIIFGTVFSVYQIHFPSYLQLISTLFLSIYGLFSGVFVGCLSIAIAEMLDTLPIFSQRLRIKPKTGILILCMAFGKLLGSLFYFIALTI